MVNKLFFVNARGFGQGPLGFEPDEGKGLDRRSLIIWDFKRPNKGNVQQSIIGLLRGGFQGEGVP